MEYSAILQVSPLFQGIEAEELSSMLQCLSARTAQYAKRGCLLRPGEEIHSVGLVLSGRVNILKEDFWGNQNLMASVSPGQLFAETYACLPGQLSNVRVEAEVPTTVLWLEVNRVLTVCTSACPFHTRLIRNLLSVLAGKNWMLNEKLTHLSQRSTRDKLLSYLSAQAARAGSPVFTIPFNRQQLADYLSVERSAMSAELGRMRDAGMLRFDKNRFELLQLDGLH